MGDPPKKKRQHYVPQFVLRNFSGDGANVRTLVLESGKFIEKAPIKGQCAESYFYGRMPDMEDAFADMEGKVAEVLRQAAPRDASAFAGEYRSDAFPEATEDQQRLQAHPLYAIREFVYYQAHRTAASAQSFTELTDAEVKWWVRRDPRIVTERPEVIEHLDDVIIGLKDPMAHILYMAGPFSYGVIDLTVKFLVLDQPGFILSDHPVAMRNQFGEAHPNEGPGSLGTFARGLQMFMPVSPTMTIAVYDARAYECGVDDALFVKVSSRNANILNAMQARNANECVYVPPHAQLDVDELRRAWEQRPDSKPLRVDLPPQPQPDGTFIQYGYTDTAPPPTTALPRLRCFPLRIRFDDVVRRQQGPVKSFPMRSLPLIEFVEGFQEYIDWKVKENVLANELPVHPEWKDWLASIKDPRKPKRSFRRR